MATKVYVGSARIDENGKACGGSAGDQTGREVSTQLWYNHSKGWRVFRAVNRSKALNIGKAMKAACANDNIGYDQVQRNTLYNLAAKVDFDPSKVTAKCETDCSALVRVCCAYAGISVKDFITSNEASVLLASGEFVELKGSKYTSQPDYLRCGDILVTATKGHTVVVLNDGDMCEGNFNPTDVEAPSVPESDGNLIVKDGSWNLRTGPGTNYAVAKVAHGGDKLTEANVDGWVPVIRNGEILWISKNGLK